MWFSFTLGWVSGVVMDVSGLLVEYARDSLIFSLIMVMLLYC